jgi:hypothetical protein
MHAIPSPLSLERLSKPGHRRAQSYGAMSPSSPTSHYHAEISQLINELRLLVPNCGANDSKRTVLQKSLHYIVERQRALKQRQLDAASARLQEAINHTY